MLAVKSWEKMRDVGWNMLEKCSKRLCLTVGTRQDAAKTKNELNAYKLWCPERNARRKFSTLNTARNVLWLMVV